MYLRRGFLIRYFVIVSVLATVFSEYLLYAFQAFSWVHQTCNASDSNCTKIMFIADPQIQGEVFIGSTLGYFFIWDSDRYLRSTFEVALNQFKPDILVYLGDLMDEGSFADRDQFHRYVKRLAHIFRVDVSTPITQVVVPGDRDIGHDKNLPRLAYNLRQFDRVFDQPPVIKHQGISFYKVNGITEYYHKLKDDQNLKFVVSHIPILQMAEFGPQVHKQIKPTVYFCAHEHLSQYEVRNKAFQLIRKTKLRSTEYLHLKFDKDFLYEIYVPTCSYRLGATEIGFGAAIIEDNYRSLKYTVLWSPARYPSLFLYFAIFMQLFFYLSFCLCKFLLQRTLMQK